MIGCGQFSGRGVPFARKPKPRSGDFYLATSGYRNLAIDNAHNITGVRNYSLSSGRNVSQGSHEHPGVGHRDAQLQRAADHSTLDGLEATRNTRTSGLKPLFFGFDPRPGHPNLRTR